MSAKNSSLVLGADSFGDFLTTSEYLRRVAQHDQDILDDLKQTLEDVETAKAAVLLLGGDVG